MTGPGKTVQKRGGGSVIGYGYDEKFASSGSMSLAGLDSASTAVRTGTGGLIPVDNYLVFYIQNRNVGIGTAITISYNKFQDICIMHRKKYEL